MTSKKDLRKWHWLYFHCTRSEKGLFCQFSSQVKKKIFSGTSIEHLCNPTLQQSIEKKKEVTQSSECVLYLFTSFQQTSYNSLQTFDKIMMTNQDFMDAERCILLGILIELCKCVWNRFVCWLFETTDTEVIRIKRTFE